MANDLYMNFRDPTEDFKREPRAFVYDLALELIERAKEKDGGKWYLSDDTINAIFLILYAWNFASPITKKLTRDGVRGVILSSERDLRKLEGKTIVNFTENDEVLIESVFSRFKDTFGQTGASKALSLLNPNLFVMWDTKIRRGLRKNYIRGIGNGERSAQYVWFLRGIKGIIEEYGLTEKIEGNAPITKKIDEFHYVKFVMEKK